MTDKEIRDSLDSIANRLVPVSGYLMYVACSNGRVAREPQIHEKDCNCQLCKAFLATEDCVTKLSDIVKALDARNGGNKL